MSRDIEQVFTDAAPRPNCVCKYSACMHAYLFVATHKFRHIRTLVFICLCTFSHNLIQKVSKVKMTEANKIPEATPVNSLLFF